MGRWSIVGAKGKGQKRSARIVLAFCRMQRRLRGGGASSRQQVRAERQREFTREGLCEFERLIVAAAAQARAVQWHGHQRFGSRRRRAGVQHQLREQPADGEIVMELETREPAVERRLIAERGDHARERRRRAAAGVAAEGCGTTVQRQATGDTGGADPGQGGVAGGTQIAVGGTALAAALAARAPRGPRPASPSPTRRLARAFAVNRKLPLKVDTIRHGFQTAGFRSAPPSGNADAFRQP